MHSDVKEKAFYQNFNVHDLQRGNALSQYHFQNLFLKNAEIKFAFFSVYTRYCVYELLFSDALWNSKQMMGHIKITD